MSDPKVARLERKVSWLIGQLIRTQSALRDVAGICDGSQDCKHCSVLFWIGLTIGDEPE